MTASVRIGNLRIVRAGERGARLTGAAAEGATPENRSGKEDCPDSDSIWRAAAHPAAHRRGTRRNERTRRNLSGKRDRRGEAK